ncbi:hypothetical protein QYM36_013570 [Artemia franciscana]|uniref:Uncharacterized protein n=1 Tax=Artemia franciscana TaxID=6661 RepID=A0AA88KWH4_ARTSF|nr:hypothetical protein QYM36_013570 [Artemia franciscana]
MDPSSAVLPGDIRPFPKAGPRKFRGGVRAQGCCQVLTDTSKKKRIEEKAVGQINKKNQTASKVKKPAKKVSAKKFGRKLKYSTISLSDTSSEEYLMKPWRIRLMKWRYRVGTLSLSWEIKNMERNFTV